MFLGTVKRMILGWLLASIAGIALGAVIGSSTMLRTYLQPTLEVLRPLPASAVIPVAIALFGLTDSMALTMVAFGALWPTLLSTVHGFSAVSPRLYEVSTVLGLSKSEQIFKISLPSALPDILAGMRLSLTIALVMAVVCEMLASRDGLGQWILMAGRRFRSADLFAGLILLGLIGIATAALLTLLEQRLLRWKVRH
jgi:ABC-type nitrate/sulfonate/bicarbonate transport system permease component